MGLILAAAQKAPAARTADETSALEWFGRVQQNRNIAVAQAAKAEYERFYGATRYTNQFPSNACGYKPPAPYEAEYPGSAPRWRACYDGRSDPFDPGPAIATSDDFTRWGNAAVAGKEFSGEGVYVSSGMAAFGIGLAAAVGAVGAAAGAIGALPVATAFSLLAVFTPYSAVPAFATIGLQATSLAGYAVEASAAAVSGAIGSSTATTAGITAAGAFGIAAVVIVALTAIITRIIQVVQASTVGQTLLDSLTKAQNTPVTDYAVVLAAPGGTATLMRAVTAVTLGRDLASFAGGVSQPGAGGPVLLVNRIATGPVRTNRISYLTDSATNPRT